MYFESRGCRLHYRRWWVEHALGVVVIAHGLGEHSGRYRQLARQLNQIGYSVYALDHYGHGQSPGRRGDIDDFASYSSDFCQFVQLVQRENPERPVHLLGHSMGAVVVAGSVLRGRETGWVEGQRIESLILSAPGFQGAAEPGKWELKLLSVLHRLVPKLTLPNRLNPDWVCRDPAVVKAYLEDDLVHNRISLRWFTSFLRQRALVLQSAASIQTPCLMLLPEGDRLVDPEVSRDWFEQLGSRSRRLCSFPNAYHEVFNEPGVSEQAWAALSAHLSSFSRSERHPFLQRLSG